MNLTFALLPVLVVGLSLSGAAAEAPQTAPAVSEAPSVPASTAGPEAASPPPAPPANPPAARELIYQGQATSILGRQVRDPEGQPVGRIVDVLVDDSGMPRAAIIDFGGFLGVGNRLIAVAWRALRFTPAADQGAIALDMTQEQIRATPEYRRRSRPADPPVAVAAPPPQAPPAPTSEGAAQPTQPPSVPAKP